MKVLFDALASLELNEAIEFYNLEVDNLGLQFKKELKRIIRIVLKHPQIGTQKIIAFSSSPVSTHIFLYRA